MARDCGVSSDGIGFEEHAVADIDHEVLLAAGRRHAGRIGLRVVAGLLAQAEIASAATRTAASRAARKMCMTLVIPVPPFSRTQLTGR